MQFAAEMHSDCRARLLSRSTFNFLESRTERGSFVGSNNAKGWHDIGLGSSGAVAVIEFGNIQRISEMFDLCLVENWFLLTIGWNMDAFACSKTAALPMPGPLLGK